MFGRCSIVAVVACLLVATVSPAAGQPEPTPQKKTPPDRHDNQDPAAPGAAEKAEQLYLAGAALYRARKYRLAIEKFRAAYRTFAEANLLYNMARCYEALGHLKQALELYQRFVKQPQAAKAAKAKAEKRIRMLAAVLESAKAAKEQPDESETKRLPSHAKRRTPIQGVVATPVPRRSSGALRVSKWVVGSLGLALAGGGAAAFFFGHSDHNKVTDAKNAAGDGVAQMTLAEARRLRDDGNTKKLIGYVLWGAAGAAVITSALLFILDSGNKEEPAVKTAIAPTQGGVTWTLQARF